MSNREIVVTEDVAGAAAERLAAAVRPGANIALAGGSTPRKAYEQVAALDLNWSGTELWLGDDRAVPEDHEHSNYRMVRESLGDVGTFHWIQGELGHERAADAYQAELEAMFHGTPRFDLILLGLGPDAHTASLFPGDSALGERERFAVGVETPGMAPLVSRVTLTLPVLNAGKEVVFLIAGEDKADAVARAFGDAAGPDAPASLVRPDSGLTLLLDPPAAARLGATG